ncbi:MAG: CopG family transcriptional regulator [Flavobacteriales bacterium CG_4_9_14_3_um_filter_32_8]|nr:MAG: CopG family transcriptional regulator [Flavobacteriales bacterium CG_4_9_14_3_um_filter_32_8]
MTTFTSTLPDNLLQLLNKKAKELAIPKNKIIEKALSIYLEHLNKAAYIKSFKKMTEDDDTLSIAEEGMEDYLTQVNDAN